VLNALSGADQGGVHNRILAKSSSTPYFLLCQILFLPLAQT